MLTVSARACFSSYFAGRNGHECFSDFYDAAKVYERYLSPVSVCMWILAQENKSTLVLGIDESLLLEQRDDSFYESVLTALTNMSDHSRTVFVIATFLSVERLLIASEDGTMLSGSQRDLILLPLPYLPYATPAEADQYLSARLQRDLSVAAKRAYRVALRFTQGHPRSIARLLGTLETIQPHEQCTVDSLVRWRGGRGGGGGRRRRNSLLMLNPDRYVAQLQAIAHQSPSRALLGLTMELIRVVATATPLDANVTLPVASVGDKRVQVSIRDLTRFEGFLLSSSPADTDRYQLGMLPCQLYAWATNAQVRIPNEKPTDVVQH